MKTIALDNSNDIVLLQKAISSWNFEGTLFDIYQDHLNDPSFSYDFRGLTLVFDTNYDGFELTIAGGNKGFWLQNIEGDTMFGLGWNWWNKNFGRGWAWFDNGYSFKMFGASEVNFMADYGTQLQQWLISSYTFPETDGFIFSSLAEFKTDAIVGMKSISVYRSRGTDISFLKKDVDVLAQRFKNELLLMQGEVLDASTIGINLNIIFGQEFSLDDKKREIVRRLSENPEVSTVNNVDYCFDSQYRKGIFYIKITLVSGETIKFGIGA